MTTRSIPRRVSLVPRTCRWKVGWPCQTSTGCEVPVLLVVLVVVLALARKELGAPEEVVVVAAGGGRCLGGWSSPARDLVSLACCPCGASLPFR